MNTELLNSFTRGFGDNQNAFTTAIWGTMLGIMLTILLLAIVGFGFYYYRKKIKLFTVRKLVYLSVFLEIFLIQAFAFQGTTNLPIPFSFDSVTVIAVGFIFGPIEGILFGQVADTMRVFINGWTYGPLPGTLYPMIGLVSGIMGLIYNNRKEDSKFSSIILFQILMTIILICIIPALIVLGEQWGRITTNSLYGGAAWGTTATVSIVGVSAIVMLALMECAFYWAIKSKNKKDDVLLLLLLSITALIDRSIDLVIRPFDQYYTGVEAIYWVSLVTRIISSTYLVPLVAVTSFTIIRTFSVAMEIK